MIFDAPQCGRRQPLGPGVNRFGAIGDGTAEDRYEPVRVPENVLKAEQTEE